MRANIDAEDDKRREKKLNAASDAEETKRRLDKNREEYELQQKLSK